MRLVKSTQQEKCVISYENLRSLLINPNFGNYKTASPDLRCALLNTCSLTDKAALLSDVILNAKLDMLLLTETW